MQQVFTIYFLLDQFRSKKGPKAGKSSLYKQFKEKYVYFSLNATQASILKHFSEAPVSGKETKNMSLDSY